MVKKLAMVFFFVGAVLLISASVFAEDSAANASKPADTAAKPADTSMPAAPKAEAAPAANETMPAVSPDEEAVPAEEGVGEGVVTGEVTALDTQAGSISVKGSDGAAKAFKVVDGETILWKGIEDIKLADIKNGDKAEVGYYTDDAGKLIASWVDVVVPEQPAAGAGSKIPPVSEAMPTAASEK